MHALFRHLFSSGNQFASGGLLLMILGSVGVFLRQLPAHLWSAIVRQTTLTITIKNDDPAFQWVKEWFLEQGFLTRVRRVDLDTTVRGSAAALMPAPGGHLFWHHGRPFWVFLHRADEVKSRSQRRVETLTFHTLGRRQAFLRAFVQDIVACHDRRTQTASLLYIYDDYWNNVQAYSPRLLDSILLAAGEKEHITQDLQRFRSARARYRQLGVPYHRGYLLYGPPGTGKTSLVSGLAGAFGMSIYALNLTELTDRTLRTAMNEVPENSCVLFEDIDAMKAGHRRTADKPQAPAEVRPGVTLSGLLNVLDGFHAPENVIFVMTTNDADALDPALLRPGRIDYRLYLGHAGTAQKAELYLRFFPHTPRAEAFAFASHHGAESMAAFQGRLLRLEQDQTTGAVALDDCAQPALMQA